MHINELFHHMFNKYVLNTKLVPGTMLKLWIYSTTKEKRQQCSCQSNMDATCSQRTKCESSVYTLKQYRCHTLKTNRKLSRYFDGKPTEALRNGYSQEEKVF